MTSQRRQKKKRYIHHTADPHLIEQQLTPERAAKLRHVAANRQQGLLVVMENVFNPHNLGAVARTCDAFGVQQIAFTVGQGASFDPSKAGWLASRSANKWLDYRMLMQGTEAALNTLKAEGWHLLAAVAETTAPSLYEVDFTQFPQLALLVGNEGRGLSTAALALADSTVHIPMVGMVASLNVSVATAILLAEITRQRRASSTRFTISDAEADALYQDFLKR
ncbi:MAG: RNA methyltransferase [Anaerolineae bacterium]